MARTHRSGSQGDEDAAKPGGQPDNGGDAGTDGGPAWPPVPNEGNLPQPEPGTTGAYLVLMREDAVDTATETLTRMAGLSVVSAEGLNDEERAAPPSGAAYVFDDLGVAVVDAPLEQLEDMQALSVAESGILAVEPERVIYPLDSGWSNNPERFGSSDAGALSLDYARGIRDAANLLVDSLAGSGEVTAPVQPSAAWGVMQTTWDETRVTWGLQATRADVSRFSGRGIKLAVLDTGLDLAHPDFAGRTVETESFISGETVQDRHGHGTHCVGTACGIRQPGVLPRYGVAPDADIFVGKVLSDRGSGTDGSILAGIRWAVRNGCHVISMSLGAEVLPGQQHSLVFETLAQRALQRGTLIIAAAGNDSYRPDMIKPVSHPANCPSIMAVGALDQHLRVAGFSNGTARSAVDIAAPGVAVRSSWPQPTLYRAINGTSMATPHVAGVAALIAEADPGARATTLARRLLASVRQVGGSPGAVGRGLVQAP
jgi:subtilisin